MEASATRWIFLPLFWSSLTTGAGRLLRPRFVVYDDRHLVQEKLSFDCWFFLPAHARIFPWAGKNKSGYRDGKNET